jgi:nucleoid DNA-binding protein
MNRAQLIDVVARKSDLPRAKVKAIFNGMEKVIAEQLLKGEKVTITGFGTFTLSHRSARTGVSPRDPKKKIEIGASVVPHFVAGETLKRRIK